MARKLSEFFAPKALSCLRFFEKTKKDPYRGKVGEVDLQEVKKGGEKTFALLIQPCNFWIVVNVTNATELSEKWGDDVDEWIGKKITITKQKTQFAGGKEGFKLIPG